jgi:perosamine synthetase
MKPFWAIPRGIVYHTLRFDFFNIFTSLWKKIDDIPTVNKFEKRFAEYMGSQHCLAFPFARTAIYLALKAQNFPQGTKIIMPPISIKGIYDVVLQLGLEPVFVDIEKNTLCFDPEKLKQAITPDVKAILITYLYGVTPDVEALVSLSRSHNLFVIEDFSHNLNATFKQKKLGTWGDVGIYSSSSVKTFDTYGGGLLISDNSALIEQLNVFQENLTSPSRNHLIKKIITDFIRNFATSRWVFTLAVLPLLKLMRGKHDSETIKYTGGRDKTPITTMPPIWFERYSAFQASIGLRLLANVESQDNKRLNNVNTITQQVKHIAFPSGNSAGKNVYWQLVAFFDDPITTQRHLQNHKIDTASTSLELIATLEQYPFQGDCPQAKYFYSYGLFIPVYPRLQSRDIDHIVTVLNTILSSAY